MAEVFEEIRFSTDARLRLQATNAAGDERTGSEMTQHPARLQGCFERFAQSVPVSF